MTRGKRMKKILLTLAMMALAASASFASGVDLSVVACPGGAGASSDAGTLDCAGGASLGLMAVYQPVEALPDLAGIDVVFDMQINGDVGSDANFWDLAGVNSAALGS